MTIVQSSPATAFGGNDPVGTQLTATATCSTGKMIGGGINITNTAASNIAATVKSFPSAATTWSATAEIVVHTANGSPPSFTAYALCAS